MWYLAWELGWDLQIEDKRPKSMVHFEVVQAIQPLECEKRAGRGVCSYVPPRWDTNSIKS